MGGNDLKLYVDYEFLNENGIIKSMEIPLDKYCELVGKRCKDLLEVIDDKNTTLKVKNLMNMIYQIKINLIY